MDFLSLDFLSALAAIIAIDLMLAGDNAIVIALAARNVPLHLQKKAILWGMVGAIAVRISMTLIVVWLLKIPGLLAVGGGMLVIIAYRLILPVEDEGGEDHVKAASSFWGAMRTIVIADAVMGLDNVLAVAGAAQGNSFLVIAGLLISIPIVIWGSGLILRYVDRYPSIVYFGSAILAWTAAKMILGEPLLAAFIAANGWVAPLTYLLIIGGVLGLGFIKNARWIEAQINAGQEELAREALEAQSVADSPAAAARRILVPIDASIKGLNAIRYIVKRYAGSTLPEVHLTFVRHPFSSHIDRFLGSNVIENYYSEEANRAFNKCRSMLGQHGIRFTAHIERGEKAEAIALAAERLHCGLILISTAPEGSLARMFQVLLTNRVMKLTKVPVEVISEKSISALEMPGVAAEVGSS